MAETVVDLGGIVGAVAARARAMTSEFDPGGFLEGLSGQLQGLIPHDRVTVHRGNAKHEAGASHS